jgi:hypothetical protein
VPGLILVGVDKGETISIREQPSSFGIINPAVDERSLCDLDGFFEMFIGYGNLII